MDSLKGGFELRGTPALGLSPLLWHDVNLLFVPAERLTDALRELCRSLPLEVRVPHGAPGREALDEEARGAAPSIEESVAHQLALSREISALAEKTGTRVGDASLWCELLAPNGWLNVPPHEAAQLFGTDEKLFLEALGVVQQAVEPAGLFARDAAECLLLQLDALSGRGCDAGLLLTEGREALEAGGAALEAFRAARGWTRERLRGAMAALRRLDPAPGRIFSAAFVRPELDFFLAPDERGGGTLRCRLARENLPRLSLASEDLQATLARREWERARSLLLRLGLRYRTLLRIGVFVAERQAPYLSGGGKDVSALLPLGLKDVALSTGLHVSTVSRCLAHTWARSPVGALRLSSLLSRSLRGLPYAGLEKILREAAEAGESDADVSRKTGIPRRTISYHRHRLGIFHPCVKRAHRDVRLAHTGERARGGDGDCACN